MSYDCPMLFCITVHMYIMHSTVCISEPIFIRPTVKSLRPYEKTSLKNSLLFKEFSKNSVNYPFFFGDCIRV